MQNMKVFLELIADARRFKDGVRQSEQSLTSFSRRAKREAAELKNVFSSLQGKLAAMGMSLGAGALLWQSAGLDKSLTQIGQTAGVAGREVKDLRNDLFRLGKESGQDVDKLKEGFNVLVQSGLNMKESRATLEGVNAAMAVTGSDAKTLAGGLTVAATAFQFDLAKPGMALELLDKMTVAGRLGNAELENLSDIFARVGVNAASAGMNFNATLAFVEGLSKIERQPERLATLADSTLRVFTNLRYMADAQKATGIKFFDAKGQRRDAMAVLEDIREKYTKLTTDKQRAEFIQKAFGKADLDTIKGIKTLLTGDSLNNVRQFTKEISKAGGTLKKDMDAATSNLVDQAGRLKATLREAADGFAAPVKNVLADLIKWSMDSKKNGGLELSGEEMIGYGAAAVGGTALLARYGGKALKGLLGRYGKTGIGIAEGKAIQAATGVTPVFVTNWPNGDISGAPNAVKTTAWLKRLGAAGAIGGGLALPLTLATAPVAYGMYEASQGRHYGAAEVGAADMDYRARKSTSGPAKWLDSFFERFQKPEVKNEIKLNINVDQFGRVITETNSPNTNTKINVARGKF